MKLSYPISTQLDSWIIFYVYESIDDVSDCSKELKKAINELGDDLQTYCWGSVLSDVETEDVFIEWGVR